MTSTPWSRPPSPRSTSSAPSSTSCARRSPTRCRRSATSTRSSSAPGHGQRPRRAHPRPGLPRQARDRLRRPRLRRRRSLRPRQRRRRRRLPQGAFGESVCALTNGNPTLAMFRPYTPELVGWFDDFSHPGTFDALGGVGRIGTSFNQFTRLRRRLPRPRRRPSTPTTLDGPGGTLQNDLDFKCPGAEERPLPPSVGEGGNVFTDSGNLDCDPDDVLEGAMRRIGFILLRGGRDRGRVFAVSGPGRRRAHLPDRDVQRLRRRRGLRRPRRRRQRRLRDRTSTSTRPSAPWSRSR